MAYRTKESALADKILAWLKETKEGGAPIYWEHRSGSGGFNYKKGVPDLFVVVAGTHIELELKAPDGKLSPMQEKFRYRCQTEWLIPYATPRTLEEAQQAILPWLGAKEKSPEGDFAPEGAYGRKET